MSRTATRAMITIVLALTALVGVPAHAVATSAAPVVSAVYPTTGRVPGATRVTIAGENFAGVRAVRFGDRSATGITALAPNRLQVSAPAHAAGTVHVQVLTSHGWSAPVAVDRYTYVSPPAVTAVSPHSAAPAGGRRVTVTGARFLAVVGVRFGTANGTHITVLSSTRLQVDAPAHPLGRVDIRVLTRFGWSPVTAADRFSYLPPPSVMLVDPASGPTTGGSTVTITATDPVDVTSVWFGGVRATVRRIDQASLTLTVVTPPRAASVVDVRVVTLHGNSPVTTQDRFRFAPPNPTAWTPHLIDPPRGQADAVSCATAAFCTAVDFRGHAYRYNGATWSAATQIPITASAVVDDVSCPTTTFCAAVGRNAATTSTAFVATYNGTGWSSPQTVPGASTLTRISCPASTFCAATGPTGQVSVRRGSTWSTTRISGAPHFTAVSCASSTLCAAVATGGRVVRWTGTSWTAPVVVDGGRTLTAVSCTAAGCRAGDVEGGVIAFDQGAWSGPTAVLATTVDAVSCASTTSCVAVGSGSGAVFGNGTWAPATHILAEGSIADVSCATSASCVAVNGNASTRYDGANWTTPITVDPRGTGHLGSVSCPTSTFCAAVDSGGYVTTFDGTTWSTPVSLGVVVDRLSCGSTSLCVALGSSGSIARYDGTTWSTTNGAVLWRDVSCVGSAFCLAVGSAGWSTYDGTSWTAPVALADPGATIAVSCVSPTACRGVGGSATTTFDGSTWSSAVTIDPGYRLTDVSCASTSRCAAVAQASNVFVAGNAVLWNGANWSAPTMLGSFGQPTVSCSATACVATDAQWISTLVGAVWSAPVSPPGMETFGDVSCAPAGRCVAVDSAGHAVTSG